MFINREDQIPGLKTGRCSGAIRLNGVDPRAHGLLAVYHEHHGENRYRQDEIRQRSGDDDGRALVNWLEEETLGAVAGIHGL